MPTRSGAVHVATTKRHYKGKVYMTHLLRRTYRQEGKVKHQTLGNISHLPPDLIEDIRDRLKGSEVNATTRSPGAGQFEILRSLPHGHVAAVLGTIRSLGLDSMLSTRPCEERTLCIAMIAARLIDPRSKLATARFLKSETATMSLALELGVELSSDQALYDAMDWLIERQEKIEKKLAGKHLEDGSLVLYDVSSSFYTGTHCSLAKFGHNRDGKNGYPQIVYGLLCNQEGCPVAIEVFEGNTADPATLRTQIEKLCRRFGIKRIVLVGDRGMITSRRIDEELRPIEGLDWITALRSDNIRQLVEQGTIQPSLFDDADLMEVESPEYPDERLIVCRNPLLAAERARKREELLAATEKKLDAIVAATERANQPLRGKDAIALRIGKVIDRHKVGKHFVLTIEEDRFSHCRNEEKIAAESELDGLYVIRTSVASEQLSAEAVVRTYKDLSKVERAFRSLKTVDLKVRPIHHRLENRVRAHVLLCMLAYYVEWHMRRKLETILFDDDDRAAGEALRKSVVAPARRSPAAQAKDGSKRTADGLPVHSFRTLMADLATLAKNLVCSSGRSRDQFYMLTQATPLQSRAFALLGVAP